MNSIPVSVPVSLVFVLGLSIWLCAHFSPRSYERLSSRAFWSMYGGGLAAGLFFSCFVGIMSTGAPNVTEPLKVFLTVALSLILIFAIVGFFPAYFLDKPRSTVVRALIGGIGLPVLTTTTLSIVEAILGV